MAVVRRAAFGEASHIGGYTVRLSGGFLVCCIALIAFSSRGATIPDLWVVNHDSLTPAEQLLGITLQGVVNRKSPRVWMDTGGMSGVILAQLSSEGTRIHNIPSVWNLFRQFRTEISGAVVCKLGTPSVSVATSLCGPESAIAVDETLLSTVQAGALPVLHDARGEDSTGAWTAYRNQFAQGIAAEQAVAKAGYLGDFLVAHNAFCFDGVNSTLRTSIVSALGPGTLVYGWGTDEYQWISDISQGGGGGVASDWCLNLSAMEKIPAAAALHRKARAEPAPPGPNERIVAFVLSDGDNVQWLAGTMPTDTSFYASALRGQFPMTWEVSPILASVAPRVLEYLYANATSNDDFISMGAPAYSYQHLEPVANASATQTEPFLKAAGLDTVSVINGNGGSLDEMAPLLDLPETLGVIYKDYSPYNGHHGAMIWRNGKPCVSYRYLLWEGMSGASPSEVAASIAVMPAAASTETGSYALINVHAWSWASIGGPIEAVRRTIAALPANTRVVTANDLLTMLRNTFGRPVRYTWADAVACLRIAAGVKKSASSDLTRYNVATSGASAGAIDMADALMVTRSAAGL
jgi:hypothetical protein